MVWIYVLGAYFGMGLFIMAFTSARREISKAIQEIIGFKAPLWVIALAGVILVLVSLIVWPLFLKGWFAKKPSVMDHLQRNPDFQRQKQLYNLMSALAADGCDADELPGASGEFGLSLSNPIPTKTILGSTSYLARLRTPDGEKVLYERIGSFSSEVSPNPIDGYAIKHPNGTDLGTLYLSPYQKRNSKKVPRGFTIDLAGDCLGEIQ